MPKNKELSDERKYIITLLNNISELISKSNNRQDSREVMKAIVIYAESKNVKISEDKVSSFYNRLLDARPITLCLLTTEIAKDILMEKN